MPHEFPLKGRVAIVTGAGKGMGEATALLFAEAGARVVVSDIDAAAGKATAQAITAAGGEALFLETDVSREADIEALVARTVAHFGRLDCAVNNAGIRPDTARVSDADMAVFDQIMAVNLRAVMLAMKHQIRQLLAQGGGGAIVNIASINGVRVQPGSAAYSASKAGVISLSKVAAVDHGADGIRVNCVLPGLIDTPMLHAQVGVTGASIPAIVPGFSLLNRLGQPREVAQASLWLVSDAASYVTGQAIAVDAGYLAR